MGGQGRRHCWECYGRRLVCDSTHPECQRCVKAGKTCPGYSDRKPVRIRWLAPGQVQSKMRKSKNQRAGKVIKATEESVTTPEMVLLSPQLETVEMNVLFDATEYCMPAEMSDCVEHRSKLTSLIDNTYIGPTIQPMHELTPNLGLSLISPPVFQLCMMASDHIKLLIVCASLSHRINQSDDGCPALERKLLHYRGLMIKSLREDLSNEYRQKKDSIICGALSLLMVDVSQYTEMEQRDHESHPADPHLKLQQRASDHSWRYHLEAVRQLVKVRGGFRVLSENIGLRPLLHTFLLYVIGRNDKTGPN